MYNVIVGVQGTKASQSIQNVNSRMTPSGIILKISHKGTILYQRCQILMEALVNLFD